MRSFHFRDSDHTSESTGSITTLEKDHRLCHAVMVQACCLSLCFLNKSSNLLFDPLPNEVAELPLLLERRQQPIVSLNELKNSKKEIWSVLWSIFFKILASVRNYLSCEITISFPACIQFTTCFACFFEKLWWLRKYMYIKCMSTVQCYIDKKQTFKWYLAHDAFFLDRATQFNRVYPDSVSISFLAVEESGVIWPPHLSVPWEH